MTRSTRCTAVSAILRPPHELQTPRYLQEYGSSRSLPHCVHRRRKKPYSLMPHLRNDRNSSSTKACTTRSRCRCIARNVSNCSATTRISGEFRNVESNISRSACDATARFPGALPLERSLIQRVLLESEGNHAEVARRLDLSPNTSEDWRRARM